MAIREFEELISSALPLPACVVNRQGKVVEASGTIGDVFLYEAIQEQSIYVLIGVRVADLFAAAERGEHPVIRRNEKIFRLLLQKIKEDDGEEMLLILFDDVTSLEALKDLYNEERLCIAKVQVDNYDELTGRGDDQRMAVAGEIDRLIRKWAASVSASVTRARNNAYVIWFEQRYLEKLVAARFDILDVIRSVESGADFPASLSIGVGVGGRSPAQTEEFANAALELALGRGGDQAVVKRNQKIEYFGGKLQTVEKSNKGKSRMIGHALRQLIVQSKRVFIMGHRNPDMDCFGAALSIYRLCELNERRAYLVIEDCDEALQTVYDEARTSENYLMINNERALALADADCLVVVLDTHRPSMTQCPALLEKSDRIVVIDHHRRMEASIENPTLAYMETYASSTCELVAEIMQYMTTKRSLTKLEAEALLAGILVDTNHFASKVGVRTFEAAAWLRRQGADTGEVRRFFKADAAQFVARARAMAGASFDENGVAIACWDDACQGAQVICAQVADQLLTVRHVRASFVIGTDQDGQTVISARSLGDLNVQVIMEQFGGGGHLTMAAAQVRMPVAEAAERIRRILEETET